MKLIKRIRINSDTNLFALNAIVVPVAFFYLEVILADSGRPVKFPIRTNPNVTNENRLSGVDYRMYIPVLACHPVSDDEFHIEFGYTDVNSRYFDMSHEKRSSLAYIGTLPDVADSDVRDKRYVTPLRVYTVPIPDNAPMHVQSMLKRSPVYGATLHTDYLRTSALDQLDDETWDQIRNTDPRGMAWSEFLDQMTAGRYTPVDDLSNCIEAIDQEYIPDNLVKRIRIAQFDKRG